MRALKLTSAPPLFQRDGDTLYMTLQLHKVDDRTDKGIHRYEPVKLPEGWQIAEASQAVMRMCGAHPWQCKYLVLSDGVGYGTILYSGYTGKMRAASAGQLCPNS
jgi:hypothetical protein